jgi:hypothetical protein
MLIVYLLILLIFKTIIPFVMVLEQRVGDENIGVNNFSFGDNPIHGQEEICRTCDFVIPVKRALLPSAPACKEFDRLKMQHQVPSEPNLMMEQNPDGTFVQRCYSKRVGGVRVTQ